MREKGLEQLKNNLCANLPDKHSHKTGWPFGSDSETILSRPPRSINSFQIPPPGAYVPPEQFAFSLCHDLDPAITVCRHHLAPNPVAI